VNSQVPPIRLAADDEANGDNRPVERRRVGRAGQSAMATLEQLPALVVLERIPVPVLAIAEDGSILFANRAFAEMLGYSTEAVVSLKFHEIFHTMPPDESPVSAVRALADLIVELAHVDGSTVRARMSRSALWRGDDPVALATFVDLTEQLWTDET
jgi:PAS domain S-box-containing protein